MAKKFLWPKFKLFGLNFWASGPIDPKFEVQWLSMVWDKIPMIWDIIDLANYSLDWYDDLTKSDYHGNSNVADTKK